jgi:DNA modification methylase
MATHTLFDIDKDFGTSQEEQGPVTCLGMTFTNDNERRAYFREELRKKLPELKKIEGFPVGEDEDIINLSDPPYYTACPNPWLNDFIQKWEEEKIDLEKSNKRHKVFEVSEPYSYGISQGKNSAIYNAHSYHTKVPHQVIMRYILHYTQPGDIILDGFSGTGMTGVAASSCENPDAESKTQIELDFQENGLLSPQWGIRHAVCGDLSPLCFHIASNYNDNINIEGLRKAVRDITKALKERFGEFYELETEWGKSHVNYFVWSEVMSCNSCGEELNVHNLSFNYETRALSDKLLCPKCGTSQKRSEAGQIFETIYDDISNSTSSQIKYECCLMNITTPKNGRQFSTKIPSPTFPEFVGEIPTDKIPEVGDEIPRLHKVGCDTINKIYHKRTQYVLAFLNETIHKKHIIYQKELMFIFTSMLPKLTRLNRYMPQHGSRALVGPMANTLYIPPQGVENNPIDQWEYQAGKVLRAFELCNSGSVVQTCSATNSSLSDCSIDYIFTDPPFGANIMYSELNTISESWLKVSTNNQEEAISNKTQHKGIAEYQGIMTRCFKEYHRVLKPGHWMTVEFSNTSAAFWNSLQYSIKSAGFIISAITDLNKERGGLHAMLGPTAVKQDLAISCYKPAGEIVNVVASANQTSVWEMVESHLNHVAKFIQKGGKAVFITERDPRIIYDRVISFFIQNGQSIPMSSVEFQQGLRDRFIEKDGMFFTASQAAEYEQKKKATSEFVPMGIIVSDEANGIQWLRNELGIKAQTYQDLQPKWMQALVAQRKGDCIPGLDEVLSENFIKEDDGKWRLPNANDEKDLEILRTRSLLKEFNLCVEQASRPRAKIKEVRVEALRAGFKQCYIDKDFKTIVMVGDKIPENLLTEDEVLLQYYDIASSRV